MTTDKEQQAEGLQFPCRYPVKAMGKVSDDLDQVVVAIVERHVGKVAAEDVRIKSSSAGNFQSITVTIDASSRELLETIYQELSDCEQVLWTL
jgi:putative lipoic acid-binding regulatory protein